jgi:hypothetical protein
MLKRYNVVLVNSTEGSKDKYGGFVEGEPIYKNMTVDIQPSSRELFLKTYGYDVEVNKLMFCNTDSDIKIGSIIEFNNIDYEVRSIPWDDGHMEVGLYGI